MMHISKSGARANQWTDCKDEATCHTGGQHITKDVFYAAKLWFQLYKLSPRTNKTLSQDDVNLFLAEANQVEWKEELDASRAETRARRHSRIASENAKLAARRRVYEANVNRSNKAAEVAAELSRKSDFARKAAADKKREASNKDSSSSSPESNVDVSPVAEDVTYRSLITFSGVAVNGKGDIHRLVSIVERFGRKTKKSGVTVNFTFLDDKESIVSRPNSSLYRLSGLTITGQPKERHLSWLNRKLGLISREMDMYSEIPETIVVPVKR